MNLNASSIPEDYSHVAQDLHRSPTRRLKVRTRLLLCFLLVVSFMLVITGASIHKVNRIDTSLSFVMDVAAAKQRYAVNMRGSVHDQAIAARDLALLPTDQGGRDMTLQAEIRQLGDMYAQNWELVNGRQRSNVHEQALLDNIQQAETRAAATLQQLYEARLERTGNAAAIALDELGPAFVAWLDAINAYIDLKESNVRANITVARDTATTFALLIAVVTAIAMVLSLVIATLIARKLQAELGAEPHELSAFAAEIGKGNLKIRPALAARDIPPGSALEHLLAMATQLQNIVSNVRDTATAVAQAGTRMDHTTLELARRTENQATAVGQTATAVEQLSQVVHQNAEAAQAAAQRATQASATTTQLRQAMTQVRDTMQQIDAGSKQVGEITSLIDAIAFQTNILALNASVEAARAGAHGKGFAVVATEVRHLAQRSSEAASHISRLLEENQQLVLNGTRFVEAADQHTRSSLETVQGVTDLIHGISQGSVEQATGVRQIRAAVAQIHEITENNTRMVRDTTVLAAALSQESERLRADMRVFKV